ncbi:hypothetical protein ES703_74663 [subsurface metagenome]
MGEPPDVKGYIPKEIFQKILSENLWEVDLDLDPKLIPWIYISNIIQRTLSRMIGQGPFGPVTVRCTKEGNLAVVSRGGAFDDYERQEHAFAAAGEEHEFTLTQQVERIDIFTYSDRVEYQLTRDLVKAFGDKIELFEDSFYSLDFYTRRVKATCVSFTPKSSGTTDGTGAKKLIASGVDFVTQGIESGHIVANITDQTGKGSLNYIGNVNPGDELWV